MKNIFKLFSVTLLLAVIATSCMEVDPWFESFDPATSDVATTVLLSEPNITVSVNPTEATTTVTIGVSTWGAFLDQDLTLPFVVDEASMDASWYTIAGSGFTIPAGSNAGSLVMTIDNTVFPAGYWDLKYHLGTPSIAGVTINENALNGVVDAFSPGDLWPLMGTFDGAAASLGAPGDWDEAWTCTIVLNKTNPDAIDIYGVAGKNTGIPLVGVVDRVAGTITVATGQMIGNPYGYGDSFVYDSDAPWGPTSADLVGTVDMANKSFYIPRMGITTGPYYWDVFNVTFTSAGKAANYVEIPSTKKPHKL